MKTNRLPKTDSIQSLARFWDSHDLTDFEDDLTEIPIAVFVADDSIRLRLNTRDANAVRRLAESKGSNEIK